jgi:hypothetical protein
MFLIYLDNQILLRYYYAVHWWIYPPPPPPRLNIMAIWTRNIILGILSCALPMHQYVSMFVTERCHLR